MSKKEKSFKLIIAITAVLTLTACSEINEPTFNKAKELCKNNDGIDFLLYRGLIDNRPNVYCNNGALFTDIEYLNPRKTKLNE